MKQVFILVVALTACTAPALAQGDAQRGQTMARERCAACHAISGPGPSPVAKAPAFSLFGRKWPIESLAEALAEGIVTGHGPVRMPEFVLTAAEIDDLLAYLQSVAP